MLLKKSTSACPHDCPSTCVLEIEHNKKNIFKVKGSKTNSYTSGIICGKVSRYKERTHNKNRLLKPLKRLGDKGLNNFKEISWNEAIEVTSEKILLSMQKYGSESVLPYYYAGTMGLIQRDGINRLTNAMSFSRQKSTICNTLPETGWMAGVGALYGPDPREVKYSELIIIWGGNPASTQVNFMKHVQSARKKNNSELLVVDPYVTRTAKIADYHLKPKPGTDGALACAFMHIMFRDHYADLSYLKNYTDYTIEFKNHLEYKTPKWASKITGIEENIIEQMAKLIGIKKRVYTRLGYGFTRQRNGAVNMHAVVSLATVCGKWKYKGGGAFYSNGGIYKVDKTLIEGLNLKKNNIRELDQSRIGSVLTGNKNALKNGVEVTSILIQNTNPLVVAPETSLIKKGFLRKNLFVCVHEQFMTDTAKYADIILPATTFVEHDDIYISGGHQHMTYGPKLIEPIGESWSNHKLINTLAKNLGASHKSFSMSEKELINQTLIKSDYGDLKSLTLKKFLDLQPNFITSHFIDGFGHKDKKFHFKPKWKDFGANYKIMPKLPDFLDINEKPSKINPFKLVTAPAHNFLNSSFTETKSSKYQEARPKLKIHPNDIKKLKMINNELVKIGNKRGEVHLHLESFDGLQEGVVIVEGVWPNSSFINKQGINTLVGSDPAPPAGGAVFHDVAIWIKKIN